MRGSADRRKRLYSVAKSLEVLRMVDSGARRSNEIPQYGKWGAVN